MRRLRDLLERYRPGERPVAEEFIHELRPVLGAEGALAWRPVRGELGWSVDYIYCTMAHAEALIRDFLRTATDGFSPYFPVTPRRLRNRAIRTKVTHRLLNRRPSSPRQELIKLVERTPGYGMKKDDLGVSVCDGDVALGWIGTTRAEPFGRREMAILDALVPSLQARMLLEHQLGHARASRALLEAALDAIPTAAFIVRGASIEHANATGRILLGRERVAIVDRLRESMRTLSRDGPFAITPVEVPGVPPMALAVLRGGAGEGEIVRRMGPFAARFGLTPRQGEVLALLARGYGNKTIAERVGLAEGTVEEHITTLFRKAGVDARAELVAKFWMD